MSPNEINYPEPPAFTLPSPLPAPVYEQMAYDGPVLRETQKLDLKKRKARRRMIKASRRRNR